MSRTTEQAIILLNARLSLCVHDLQEETAALLDRTALLHGQSHEDTPKLPSEPGIAASAQRCERLNSEARLLRELLEEIERAGRK